MIRIISYPYTVQTVEVPAEDGSIVSLEIIVPPCDNAIRRGKSNIWISFGNTPLREGARVLTGAAKMAVVPRRFDIDTDHPLYGMRILPNVPAGYNDVVLRNSDQKLVFFNGSDFIDPEDTSDEI